MAGSFRELGHVIGTQPKSVTKPDLNDPRGYLDSQADTSDSAVFPHVEKHPEASAFGLGSKEESRNRFHEQVRDGVRGHNWRHSASAGKLSAASSKVSRRLGNCRYSVYLTPESSIELLEMGAVLCERRMGFNSWRMEI